MGRILFTAFLLTAFQAHADLILQQGHVRAMPPGQPNTAAFMSLKNTGATDIKLLSASTAVAKKAEFHTHSMNASGVMSMSKLDYIVIKAGDEFEFKSGAQHVMIMGLKHTLKSGETVGLTLQDSLGHNYTYEMPVQSVLGTPMNHHHHHDQE